MGGKVRGESELHEQLYGMSKGLKHMTKDMLGEKRLLWGLGAYFPSFALC